MNGIDLLELVIGVATVALAFLIWRILTDPPEELPFLEDGEGRYIIELPDQEDCESCELKGNCPLYKEGK